MLAEWGKGPVLIEPVAGRVTLRGLDDAKSVQATALTAEGRPAGSALKTTGTDSGWSFQLGELPTTWWVLEVNR